MSPVSPPPLTFLNTVSRASASRISTLYKSAFSGTFCLLPETKLSMTCTSYPPLKSEGTRVEPKNPAPPVTIAFLFTVFLFFLFIAFIFLFILQQLQQQNFPFGHF